MFNSEFMFHYNLKDKQREILLTSKLNKKILFNLVSQSCLKRIKIIHLNSQIILYTDKLTIYSQIFCKQESVKKIKWITKLFFLFQNKPKKCRACIKVYSNKFFVEESMWSVVCYTSVGGRKQKGKTINKHIYLLRLKRNIFY